MLDTIFKVGDVVVYSPSYPVDGKWLDYQRTKQEFVVSRGNETLNLSGKPYTNIVVTYMQYAGLHRDEIPYGKSYQLTVKSFYHLVPQHPTWEL